jgi:hypothetical protein
MFCARNNNGQLLKYKHRLFISHIRVRYLWCAASKIIPCETRNLGIVLYLQYGYSGFKEFKNVLTPAWNSIRETGSSCFSLLLPLNIQEINSNCNFFSLFLFPFDRLDLIYISRNSEARCPRSYHRSVIALL